MKNSELDLPVTRAARREQKAPQRKVKQIVAGILAVPLLILTATVGYYAFLQIRMTSFPAPASLDTPRPHPTEPFNLAIFGTDSRSRSEQSRADTIILARIDPVEQRMWMVSIPRDTRVELPDHGSERINAAYAYGGPNWAIQAVKDVTGQEVHYFISMDLRGFENVVDAMGGIKFDVPVAIDGPASEGYDYRTSPIEPGLQELDGEHALTVIRHRDSYIDGDFDRVRVQQDFLNALVAQMEDVPNSQLPGVVNSLANNISTNFTPLGLAQAVREIHGISEDHLYIVALPGEWRAPYVSIDRIAAEEIWASFGVAPFE